jgi:hypothetical protein
MFQEHNNKKTTKKNQQKENRETPHPHTSMFKTIRIIKYCNLTAKYKLPFYG